MKCKLKSTTPKQLNLGRYIHSIPAKPTVTIKMSQDKPTANGRPPIAANLDQSMNRITIGLAKHSQILSTLNKSHATTVTTTTTPSNTLKRGFSSTTTTTPLPKSTPNTSHTPSTNPAHDRELNPAYVQAPNTGVGFAAHSATPLAGTGGAQAREDVVLKTRLLGRNAAAQKAAAGEARKRTAARGGASDSEEELGRSAVGRVRPKRARAAAVEEEATEEGGAGRESVGEVKGGDDAGKRDEGVGEWQPEVERSVEGGVAEPELEEVEERAEGAAERRKRKKRNNKKKASAESGTASV
ncbi:hypothetical protein B0H67DRAFT_357979 [Lasiosphaeris hirsuta]|uniref:Uncharacterized protein n=1 Tax=Lasiosphaeris hirsuta TaxID=260670 RepID=A0AA39ZW18_9PEZI|nr:hypothetical protein B0H67DRAFT_357979 [Lasiosphaeris hirsuta]